MMLNLAGRFATRMPPPHFAIFVGIFVMLGTLAQNLRVAAQALWLN